MAEEITIARPYAEAIYQIAERVNQFDQWSDTLQFAAAVAADAAVAKLVGNPRVPRAQLQQLLFSIMDKQLNEAGKNFIPLLLDNDRLLLLPQIQALFEQLKAEHDGSIEATVSSAFALTETQQKELIKQIEARFKRQVTVDMVVDPELIGGVKITVGDVVIDASVKGKLQDMAFTLKR